MKKIKIGTRGSKLALWQAKHVKKLLETNHKDYSFELEIIKTKGDKILDVALSKIGDKGLFTKELEIALLEKKIDLAVHSMKDMPTVMPDGLEMLTILKREKANDVFVSNKYNSFKNLPKNSNVGTSSLRRKAQLQNLRPDLNFTDIRGNVDTRLAKLDAGPYDATILAYAGIYRLGLGERITEIISFEDSLPAVGQGAIGLETRIGDESTISILNKIHHSETAFCVNLERKFLNLLEGGCQVPIACHSYLSESKIIFKGLVSTLDGSKIINSELSEPLENLNDLSSEEQIKLANKLGTKLANKLLDLGAKKIIETYK